MAVESKAADVFAFGMFAAEVFTGKIPFEGQKNEEVAHRISQGGRPEMPRNSQAIGLTVEVWQLIESCWQQDPRTRPTMEEIVRRWGKFVGDDDDVTAFPKCVQSTAVVSVSLLVPFSIGLGNRNMRHNQEGAPADIG